MKPLFHHRSLLLILALSPFLVQCLATSQDFRDLDLRLRTVNNKLISMDRNVTDLQAETAARANKSSVDDLQKSQADASNSLDYLKTQLLQVKGQIEENTHHIQKLQEDENFYRDSQSNRFHDLSEGIENLRTSLDELQSKLTALEKKSQSDNTTLQQLGSDVEMLREAKTSEAAERARKAADEAVRAARLAEEARTGKIEGDLTPSGGSASSSPKVIDPAQSKKGAGDTETKPEQEKAEKVKTSGKKKPEKTEKKKAPLPEKPAGTEEQAQKLYDDGMAAFNAKKYQEAYAAFNTYLEKHPKGNLAANARFWLGECLYNQQDYELAILEYQKVFADFPRNGKTPAALLKQGMAFEKLKDQETARLVYLKLQDEYKESEEAATAGKRLEAMK
jgi:tol-pal system protein YbgF